MSDVIEPSWSVFGKCPKPMCRAQVGEPCIDARSGPRWLSPRTLRNPHRGRPKLPKRLTST